MVSRKIEIITSAIIVFSLFLLFIIDATNQISNFLATTIFNTLIYFTICYLYTNRISVLKWRILLVLLSIGVVTLIISTTFYISAWQLDFQSRLIFGIDTVTILAFLLVIFTNDRTSIILFTTFVTTAVVIFINLKDNLGQFILVFTEVLSIILYVILSIFHVSQIIDTRWKVAATGLSVTAVVVFITIPIIYWYSCEIVFIVVTSINCCLSLVPLLWMNKKSIMKAWWKISQERNQDEQYNFLQIAGLPTRFTIRELSTATENFGAPIGEGASGAVYKGTMVDGSTIAVKRIKWQPSGEIEFRTEITIIASLQHVNLVRLLGYCLSPKGDRYLIYPFFENGSLDAWLFKDHQKRSHLTWLLRFQISIDVAKALSYLHHECHHRILHLDIKPANILLDGNFRALVSDFGISKLIGRDESTVMTRARGTIGYLPPEMLVPNAISTKSDVYSYGMVLLELVGGRRNFMLEVGQETQQRRNSYFPKIVREKMMQGRLMEVVDECLLAKEDTREEEVTVLVRLALWCIQENPELRPSMIEVVEMLEGRMPVNVPPESPMYVVSFFNVDSQSNIAPQAQEDEATLLSANSLSISIQSGR